MLTIVRWFCFYFVKFYFSRALPFFLIYAMLILVLCISKCRQEAYDAILGWRDNITPIPPTMPAKRLLPTSSFVTLLPSFYCTIIPLPSCRQTSERLEELNILTTESCEETFCLVREEVKTGLRYRCAHHHDIRCRGKGHGIHKV